jgi:hypothetical protein
MMNHERKMDDGVSTPPGIITSRSKVPTEEANAEKSISPFIRGARRAFAFSRRRLVVVVVFLCDDRHRDRRSGSNVEILPADHGTVPFDRLETSKLNEKIETVLTRIENPRGTNAHLRRILYY